jgi:hypothetical protein
MRLRRGPLLTERESDRLRYSKLPRSSPSYRLTAMNMQHLVFAGVATVALLSAQSSSAIFTPSNVTGAPYSATLITQRTEIHADGTQTALPTEEQTMYRDSAGRTRIESDLRDCGTTPCLVTIVDPLAGFRYEIYSHNKVVERFTIPVSRPPAIEPPTPDMTGPAGVISNRLIMDGALRGIGMAGNHFKTESQWLGTQMIEGVAALGGRVVTILEAGAAGNDYEVAVTNEKWVSPELRVLVLRKLLDPRYGNTISGLTHISLAEPDPVLFAPPVDYTMKDMPRSDQ